MRYMLYFLLACALCACQHLAEDDPFPPAPDPPTGRGEPVDVRLTVNCSDLRPMSKTGGEQIADLNLFLFSSAGADFDKHLFLTGTTDTTLTLVQGTYEVFTVAGVGADMGRQTIDQVRTCYFETDDPDALTLHGEALLSAYQRVTVNGPATVALDLTRSVAQLNLSIDLAPAMSDFEIQTVRLVNVPRRVKLFAVSRLSSERQAASVDIPSNGTFYILENRQGTVAGITDPSQRDGAHAPAWATYLLVSGQMYGNKIDYYIYLGRNTTDNFDIERNKQYNITMTLAGSNPSDWRVSLAEIELTPFEAGLQPYQTGFARMTITASNMQGNYYDLTAEPLPDDGTLMIDGVESPEFPIRVLTGDGSVSLDIGYTQRTFGVTAIGLTLTDRYGLSITRYLTARFTGTITTRTYFAASNTDSYTAKGDRQLSVQIYLSSPASCTVQCTVSWSGLFQPSRRAKDGNAVITLYKGQSTGSALWSVPWYSDKLDSEYAATNLRITRITKSDPGDDVIYQY